MMSNLVHKVFADYCSAGQPRQCVHFHNSHTNVTAQTNEDAARGKVPNCAFFMCAGAKLEPFHCFSILSYEL